MREYIRENKAAYEAIKAKMEAEHMGRTVLMHKGEVVDIFDESEDAYMAGCEKYGPGHFMIQLVGQRPLYIGMHALCMPTQE